MWQVESYTIEVRNSPERDTDDNIVARKYFSAQDLQNGHNSVTITGLCPSMQYWYCATTEWVNYYGRMELDRKTVMECQEFITAGPGETTEEWDVPDGPCATVDYGSGQGIPGTKVSFILRNLPNVDGVPCFPETLTFGTYEVPVEAMIVSQELAEDGTFMAVLEYTFRAEHKISQGTRISTANADFTIEMG